MKTAYFDTELNRIVTDEELRESYNIYFAESVIQNGEQYVIDHPDDFSFETWLELCTIPWNGTLVPVAAE